MTRQNSLTLLCMFAITLSGVIGFAGEQSEGVRLKEMPVLGEVLDIDTNQVPHEVLLMTSSAQVDRSWRIIVEDVRYWVAADNDGKVRYISSRDSTFVTPEGLTVGMTLDAVKRESGQEVTYELGFEHYVVLPSGWAAAFGIVTDEDGGPSDDSPVKYFFKRTVLYQPVPNSDSQQK